MRFVNKLRVNSHNNCTEFYELTTDLEKTTKNECKARLYTGRAFINLLNSCSYCDEINTCNGLVVALVPFTRC